MDWLSSPLVIGGIGGGLTVLIIGLLVPLPKCPECGAKRPRFVWNQAANRLPVGRGGWTCPNCGCGIDRHGKKVSNV